MLVEVEDTVRVESVYQFLSEFRLEKQFLEDEGLDSMGDWGCKEPDKEVISRYLQQDENTWLITFRGEGNGYFILYKLKLPHTGGE